MRVGDRVTTEHGPGTIMKVEHFCSAFPSYGILHDVFPANKPRMYKDDILYYRRDEISEEAEIKR
jgi:hypothetical protein